MTDEDDSAAGRSAAATLEATAAILPWLVKPQQPRFAPALNARWKLTCELLHQAWSERHDAGSSDLRAAVFALYNLSLETADSHCLRLGEALASVADRLDEGIATARLIAALSSCIDCLSEAEGLEHPLFIERAQHFSERLERAAAAPDSDNERSSIIDRLFIGEARERLERMRDALAALPPDGKTLRIETEELIQDAEQLSLFGIVHGARLLLKILHQASQHQSFESETIRNHVLRQIDALEQLTLAVDG